MNDARFTWSVKVISPDGYEEMFVIRSDDRDELIGEIDRLDEFLQENNYRGLQLSAVEMPAGAPGANHDRPTDPAWCHLHNVMMRTYARGNDVWYSHKIGNTFCRGK